MRIPFRHPAWALYVDGERKVRCQDRALVHACWAMTVVNDWRCEKDCRVVPCHIWTFWP